MKRIILKKSEERRIQGGHPWVYDNEVAAILEGKGSAAREGAELVLGECADVESYNKQYLGRAYVNSNSKIIARIYSRSKEGIDTGFFKRRIREAAQRRIFFKPEASYRLVFGEADFLPGLIIDRYTGWSLASVRESGLPFPLEAAAVEKALGSPKIYLAVQFLTLGMDLRREMILNALLEITPGLFGGCEAVIEKSTASVREMEGLAPIEGVLYGNFPEQGIIIFENNYPFIVELMRGQKTGHFLDQAENHHIAEQFARDKGRILDAFSYTGGFAVHCAHSGAAEVIAVDSSKPVLALLEQNAELNGVKQRITPVCADVFDTLSRYERSKEHFDMIVLDPPAFAKSRQALTAAISGYKEINLRALKLLRPGGVLISCSCSYALDEYQFKRILREAARDAERTIVQTDFRTQSACHPILIGYDESYYLKCGIYTVAAV